MMLSLKLPLTSELYVPEKKDSVIKDHHSTESSVILWLKEVISPLKTEQVVKVFMVKNSPTKTSPRNTEVPVSYQWPMPEKIPTEVNSSSVSKIPHG